MRVQALLLAGSVLGASLATGAALADNTSTNTSNNTSTNTSSDRGSSNSSSNQSSNSSAYFGRDDYRRDERSDGRGPEWRARHHHEVVEYYDASARRWRLAVVPSTGYRHRPAVEAPVRYRLYARD
jgi:hypothetical protein